jgi:hypothetical protein
MEMSWKNNILKNIFFDRDLEKGSGIIIDTESASKNLIKYQNKLFKNIVNFLYKKGYLDKKNI